MTEQEIRTILNRQREYFATGATLSRKFRAEQLGKLKASLQRHEEELNAALQQDLGKSRMESYMCEIGLTLSELTWMQKHLRGLMQEKRVPTPLSQFAAISFRSPSPYGTVLIMSPWNYPVLLTLDPLIDAIAAGKMNQKGNSTNKKGIIIAIIAGVLMSFFYRFVAAAMDLNNFESPTPTMATPYSAFFIFAIGIFISNFIINTIVMKKPFVGTPVSYKEYFQGKFSTHMVGVLGGAIWGLGTALSYIAAGKAGAAISYALGQGAPMIAALWGIFIWKEFKGSSRTVNILLACMFVLFISGLGAIIISGAN